MNPDLFIPTADPIPVPPSLSTLPDLEVSQALTPVPPPLPAPGVPTPEALPQDSKASQRDKLEARLRQFRPASSTANDKPYRRFKALVLEALQYGEPDKLDEATKQAFDIANQPDRDYAQSLIEQAVEVLYPEDLDTPEALPDPTPEPDLDQVDSLAGDILALNEQIDALTRKRDDLKAMLLGTLQSSNIETLTTARVKITQVASARQVALLVRPEKLPEIYQVVKSDDVAIRKAIASGVDLSAYLSLKPPTHYLKITPQHRR